jgi:hypothetical protein
MAGGGDPTQVVLFRNKMCTAQESRCPDATEMAPDGFGWMSG